MLSRKRQKFPFIFDLFNCCRWLQRCKRINGIRPTFSLWTHCVVLMVFHQQGMSMAPVWINHTGKDHQEPRTCSLTPTGPTSISHLRSPCNWSCNTGTSTDHKKFPHMHCSALNHFSACNWATLWQCLTMRGNIAFQVDVCFEQPNVLLICYMCPFPGGGIWMGCKSISLHHGVTGWRGLY